MNVLTEINYGVGTLTINHPRDLNAETTLSSSLHLEIRILHLGDFTYMVIGNELTAICDRDLESTPLPEAVDVLGWELIKNFPEKFERELLIDWVLDNRIWLIPLGTRTDLVIQRAERRIEETIDQAVQTARKGFYHASLGRSIRKSLKSFEAARADQGGVYFRGEKLRIASNHQVQVAPVGGGTAVPNPEASLSTLWDPSQRQAESRIHRGNTPKPEIHVVMVHPDHMELADGRKLQFR
jgi:hypothetical protein